MTNTDHERTHTSGKTVELRNRTRVQLMLPTQLHEQTGTITNTVSMNLSAGGLFITMDNPPVPGKSFRIEIFSLRGVAILSGTVEVQWRVSEASATLPCGFGARFIQVELKDEKIIHTVVQSAIHQDSLPAHVRNLSNPASTVNEMTGIQNISLSGELKKFISEYGKHGERDEFIWKWVYRGLQITSLSCIDTSLKEQVQTIKFLGVMFDVMLDDAVDQIQNKVLVEQMLLISFEKSFLQRKKVPSHYLEYLEFANLLWEEIEMRFRKLPRYSEFIDLLEFDYRQLFNCMRYALVVNEDPRRLNLAEHDLYQPHNMHMMVNATIDIMASGGFNRQEAGILREVIWNAQVMGRIGNAISTWQRELKDRDFTSKIFARALAGGALTTNDLLTEKPEKIEQILLDSQLEDELLAEWGNRHTYISGLATRIKTVDITGLISGLEKLIILHLGSRGLK
ncbi:MAG: PilZ domain-containing protein [Candidatus Scalindua sp.]|nr:PilZ domain-containing protein [Candidatus Scalindua sp.]